MYRLNNLSDYHFTETLVVEYKISNLPAVDSHHFLYNKKYIHN